MVVFTFYMFLNYKPQLDHGVKNDKSNSRFNRVTLIAL